MATINLVTGYTGTAHVKSDDDALLNRFLSGHPDSILELQISDVSDSNTAMVLCDALIDGRLARTGGFISFNYSPPQAGNYRCDGIYIVYKKAASGIESAELVYCVGAETESSASAASAIGTPDTSGAVSVSSILLYTFEWDALQTKDIIQNASLYPYTEDISFEDSVDDTTTNVSDRIVPLVGGLKLHMVQITKQYSMATFESGAWKLSYQGNGYILCSVANIAVLTNSRPQAGMKTVQYIRSSGNSISMSVTPYNLPTSLGSVVINAIFITSV